ncbi:MAG: rhodanese-like domain-containing protein [Acidobacteriota bacterium]
MIFKKWGTGVCAFLLICLAMVTNIVGIIPAFAQTKSDQPTPPQIELITVEELKAKLAKNDLVTIIDVRATDAYIAANSKIKGATHMKLRRLKHRLKMSPFKDLPRDREIVTYCACPSEETSKLAAQTILAAGFKRVRALKGGWQSWLSANGPLEAKPKGF